MVFFYYKQNSFTDTDMKTGLLYHVQPGSEIFQVYLPGIKSKYIHSVSSYITKWGYPELWASEIMYLYILCTYSYVTLQTVPAYFLEKFYEHYKSLLITFVVTSTVLLYLVWSVSLQCVFFSHGVQKCACNWTTVSAGTKGAVHGRNDLIHALIGKNFGTHCTEC